MVHVGGTIQLLEGVAVLLLCKPGEELQILELDVACAKAILTAVGDARALALALAAASASSIDTRQGAAFGRPRDFTPSACEREDRLASNSCAVKGKGDAIPSYWWVLIVK